MSSDLHDLNQNARIVLQRQLHHICFPLFGACTSRNTCACVDLVRDPCI